MIFVSNSPLIGEAGCSLKQSDDSFHPRNDSDSPAQRPGTARQIHSQRSQIAEFPHGWSKERCGLRQFRCRGRLKVAMEATWACLSYNLTRWFSLRRKRNTPKIATALA